MDRKEKALLVAVGANLFLVFFKFFLADISGSVALRMSGWHSVEGLFVSLAVFTGFIISKKEMGRFTRGISTVENVVALLISLFVFFIAYRVFVKMARPHVHMLTNVPLVTLGAILGAMICYFMARLKIYVGQQCKSPSLVADGYHCRIHVLMEIAVVVGLAGYLIGFHNLDMLMAMVVLLFVLYTGFQLFTTALVSLTSKVSADYSCHIAHDTGRRLSSRTILILSSVILAIYLSSGFYIIRWNEEGLIRRFGKEVARGIPPGLHYRLPWPIEVVDKVKVKDVRKLDTGTLLMLTGDENLINLKISVHYAVKEAAQFIYNIAAPEDFMREAAQAAVRDVIGEMAVDSLLTVTKSALQESTKVLSQRMLDDWNAGIEVISVQLLQAYPPAEVMESFRDVASAREDRETYINEAYGYLNSIVPEARGKAEQMVKEAEGLKADRINRAQGDAERFLKQLREYRKAREVTDMRLYIETMEKILPRMKKYFINPDVKQGVMDIWFLGEDVKKNVIERSVTR